MLRMKNSFAAQIGLPPKTFRPEDLDYLTKVARIAIAFTIASFIILALIIAFCILRFGFKKCMGPIKMSQVTRSYRNITWIVMSNILLIY